MTKLHRPRPPAPLTARPRLLALLEQAGNHPLTLISAPAGYGKTTLANQWLDAQACCCAWVSLDERDDDLPTFLSYVLAAIGMAHPGFEPQCAALLSNPTLPSPERIADIFTQDLLALPGELTLVLDDYHCLRTEEIHQFTARLLQHLPPDVHLILTTRADPPLPLDRLRARHQLVELRTSDLRFTIQETRELLEQALGHALTDEAVDSLDKGAEGWAVGLQLAAISLRGRSDATEVAARIGKSGHRLMVDYLMAEVLAGLPEALASYLICASVLERFCAGLCDAIMPDRPGGLDGETFLSALRRSELFITPLDDEGVWHRYHHLFRFLLRNRLSQMRSEAEIADMQLRASQWCAERGFIDEAIQYAVEAGDSESAAHLVESQAHPALDREDWRQLERWLALLPAHARSRPRLLLAQAWLNNVRHQMTALEPLIRAAQAALAANPETPDDSEALMGEMDGLLAASAHGKDDVEGAEELARRALSRLDPSLTYAWGTTAFMYISALQRSGRRGEAVAFGHAQLEMLESQQRTLALPRILIALASVHYEMAEPAAALQIGDTLLRLSKRVRMPLSLPWAHLMGGWAEYQRNHLDAAQSKFRACLALAHTANGRAVVDAYTGLALVMLGKGQFEAARTEIAELRGALVDRGMLEFGVIADSLEQRVALAQDPAAATEWGRDVKAFAVPPAMWEQPNGVLARTLIKRGRPEDLTRAAELIAHYRARMVERNCLRRLIQINAVDALLHQAQGNEAAALASLRVSVDMAAPGGALRLLVDCGPDLIPLLIKLAAKNVAPSFTRQVLAAYGPLAESSGPALAEASNQCSAEDERIIESLTNREVDVLLLLAERLSDKEIAEQLVLAVATVRKHTQNIYGKLGVDNRRAAVSAARRLRLVK